MYIHIYIYIHTNTVSSVGYLDHHPGVLLKRISTTISEFSPSVEKKMFVHIHTSSLLS